MLVHGQDSLDLKGPPHSSSLVMNHPNASLVSQLFPSQSHPPPPHTPGFPLPPQVAYDLSNGPCTPGGGNSASSASSAAAMKRKDLFTQRKQREFIPDNKKDDSYWDRRRRNNEAAKRSREKRRFNDMVLEQRVLELTKENHVLKAQLHAIKDKFGISGDNLIILEQVLATLPSNEQLLSFSKRTKVYPPNYHGKRDGGGGHHHHGGSPSSSRSNSSRSRERMSSGEMSPGDDYDRRMDDRSRSRSPFQHPRDVSMERGRRERSNSMVNHHHHPILDIDNKSQYISPGGNNNGYNGGGGGGGGGSGGQGQLSSSGSHRSSLSPSENILNLSISSSHEENMDQEEDHSDVEIDSPPTIANVMSKVSAAVAANNNNNSSTNSGLPHKLRHKINLGEKEQQIIIPPYGYVVGVHPLKPQELQVSPCTAWDHDDSTNSGSGSSDERDSGISINGEITDKFGRQHLAPIKKERPSAPSSQGGAGEPLGDSQGGTGPQRKRVKKRFVEDSVLETENVQLKSELARLATEVACLKSFLVKKTPTGTSSGDATHDENSCDSS
ncbi:nuclear factor interleukin-3-regulated protein isoform X2 [Folsomia candida]|nr:nuclear factor interleukin-3-regulated protein isoform X2 [Folsomia candida]